MKRLLAVLAALALLSGPAFADSLILVAEGNRYIPDPSTGAFGYPKGSPVYGVDQNLSQHELRTDGQGYLKVLPGGYAVLNCGIAVSTVAAGALFKGTVPVSIADYKSFDVIVQYANADTDSVCVEIFPVLKETSNALDGLDSFFSWDSTTTGPKGWIASNNQPMNALPQLASHAIYSTKTVVAGGGRQIGASASLTTSSICFPLTNKQGGGLPAAPYLNIWVLNRRLSASATNLTVDIIAKAN